MQNKYLIFILSILIILSASVVSATDDFNGTVISNDDVSDILNDDNDSGNFTELKNYLNNKNGEVELDKSYKYVDGDAVSDSGITLSKSLTLNGNGNTLDASNAVRIFKVTGNNIIFKNITFINAKSNDNGGAIYSKGNNVTFIDCTFKSNVASQGGAICSAGSIFKVENSIFESNQATYTSIDQNNRGGGAIFITGDDSIILNSQFTSNTALNALAGAIGINGNISNIISCQFDSNKARKGGAVDLHGDYAYIGFSNFTNNYIEFEAVNDCEEDGPMGAGIYILGNHSDIVSCSFINNTMDTLSLNNHLGGGVYSNAVCVNVHDCEFYMNGAAFGAGLYSHNANMTVWNCNFTNNHVTDTGAAVTLKQDNAKIFDCNFINNTADKNGGALYVDEDGATTDSQVTNCNFTNNYAKANSGALHIRNSKTCCYVSNCNFVGNVAEHNAGAITANGNANIDLCEFYGNNATRASAIRLAERNSKNKLYISNSIFGKNRADSASLIISIDNRESYSPSDVNVKITLRGNDNIANAIWNDKTYKYVFVSNITYEIYKNGLLTTMVTPEGYINPANGVENSGNGDKIWQDDRENAQSLKVQIICNETGEHILDENGNVFEKYQNLLGAQNANDLTEIDGSVTKALKSLKAGNYTVYAIHECDEYYTVIDQADYFRVYDLIPVPSETVPTTSPNVPEPVAEEGGIYPSTVQGKDVEVPEGSEINIPISSENATEIIYSIIDNEGNIVKNGTLKPGENIDGLKLPVGEYTLRLTTVVDENHTQATNTSKITVTPMDVPDNSTDEEDDVEDAVEDSFENESQNDDSTTAVDGEKSKHSKASLDMHETGNPIFGLLMVLFAVGLAQLRRFKL